MKKSSKIEVVLSSNQLHAARINKVEYQRFQHSLKYLEDDYHEHIARIQREQQGIKYHFKNVVRVVKPNRAFQLWKQAHAYELAQDESSSMIILFCCKKKTNSITFILFLEMTKFKPKSRPRKSIVPSTSQLSIGPIRPLLLLAEDETKQVTIDPIISIAENFLRPKTSHVTRHVDTQHRVINPILNMLTNRPVTSHATRRSANHQYESSSSLSLPVNSRRSASTHRTTDLDTLYRLALQNQTAYKSIDRTVIERRKLYDKEFASRHRALKGSVRSASLVN